MGRAARRVDEQQRAGPLRIPARPDHARSHDAQSASRRGLSAGRILGALAGARRRWKLPRQRGEVPRVSLGNTITFFKNFRLYTLFDYKGGFYVLNQTDWRRCTAGVCEEVNDPNVADEMKRQLQLGLEVNDALYTQKGDFIKLRDVSLTYALPPTVARRMRATRASLTLAGHNLGFLWKPDYKGLDPEVNFSGDNSPTGSWAFTRVDYWTMPMTRRITAALEIAF